MLPRGICLDACDDLLVEDEAIEELLPFFGRPTRVGQHLPEFVNAIVCQSGCTLVISGHNADDVPIDQVVEVAREIRTARISGVSA